MGRVVLLIGNNNHKENTMILLAIALIVIGLKIIISTHFIIKYYE
jgi:hypothetical protein